jgi:hypothetical protein
MLCGRFASAQCGAASPALPVVEAPPSNAGSADAASERRWRSAASPLTRATLGERISDMTTWLYQLNPRDWAPGIFRYEVNENQRWSWTYGQKRGKAMPATGDTLVFFYSPSGGSDPGIYGWAIVERCDTDTSTLYFIPTAPTNWLKMDPWWDEDAKRLCDEMRGNMKQATLFQVADDSIQRIRRGIRKWLR